MGVSRSFGVTVLGFRVLVLVRVLGFRMVSRFRNVPSIKRPGTQFQ